MRINRMFMIRNVFYVISTSIGARASLGIIIDYRDKIYRCKVIETRYPDIDKV